MAMAAQGIDASRVSRAEGVARQLEQQIVDEGLKAGERLGTKDDLRQRFGVAVATINEALRLLENRGMVEAKPGPGGGVFVSAPSTRVRLNHLVLGFKMGDAPFSDCIAVRNALEPLVCREAAKGCGPRDAKALRQIVKRMDRAHTDLPAFLSLNWELHRRIARIGANAPLKTLYLTLLDYVEDGLQDVQGDDVFDAEDNLSVHRELVEAIIDGSPKRLTKAIADHMPMATRWVDDLAAS